MLTKITIRGIRKPINYWTSASYKESDVMEICQQLEELRQPQPQVYLCFDCEVEHNYGELFVPSMRELVAIKREYDGNGRALITLKDLSKFAVCAKCRQPEEIYILASVIASFEEEQLVSCFSCEEMGKETLIPRRRAKAPGWVGCNIIKGGRLRVANMQDPQRNPALYVTSADLLKPGKDGFVLCTQCMSRALPILRNKARELGVSEDIIDRKIRSHSLIYMIEGVRRVGK